MIKGISNSGRYLTVSGGQANSNYINNYSGAQGVGNMRFNTSNQNIEIFDGSNWQMLGANYATVGLTGEAEALLDWARSKRDEELLRESMAKKHPGVADALESLRLAEERVKIMVTLTREEEQKQTT